MKQNIILQILAVLLVLHDFLYMPLETSMLTFLGALALYGITGQLLVPVLVLFIAPLLVMSVKLYKQKDGFSSSKAEEVSERVKGMTSKKNTDALTEAHMPSGVLENASIENFQMVDANGAHMNTNSTIAPSTNSVPGNAQENARFLVVPENSMPPTNSLDKNPVENPALITGPDSSSVMAALVPDATNLAPATAPSMTVGPSQA